MKSPLDQALAPPPLDPALLARVRAKLEPELERPPARSWRADAALLVGALWLLVGLVAAVLLVARVTTPAALWSRAMTLGPLLTLTALCCWASLAPRVLAPRLFALFATAAGIVGLVLVRHPAAGGSTQPEWLCTLSHLALDAAPLLFALSLVRKSAPSSLRALLVGLGVGAVGASVGELACARGAMHVLLFHVSAWVLVALAGVVLSRRGRPRSFAP